MNCDQFDDRLDQQLDRRRAVESDVDLQRHAARCPACHGKLKLWRQIETSLGGSSAWPEADRSEAATGVSPTDRRATPVTRHMVVALAVAASLLTTISLVPLALRIGNRARVATAPPPSAQPPKTADVGRQGFTLDDPAFAPRPPQESFDVVADWSGERWWESVSEDAWLLETIPAVNTVREGFAPIEKSVRRAIAILIPRGTSVSAKPASGVPPADTEPGDERTSAAGSIWQTAWPV